MSAAGPDTPLFKVPVRELCAFTAKCGDLDLRFSPSPSAQEGVAGHALVRSRRGADYEAEITLSSTYGPLLVRGRADGYDPGRNRLEEVKTHRGDLALMPDNQRALHWAQAKIYGHLLCELRGLDTLEVALVYLDIATQQETVLVERHTASSLLAFFDTQCRLFLDWAQQELAHRKARDAALAKMEFPFPDFRAGQRQLAKAIYATVGNGTPLLAQAPTGIGKTMATLFGMLKSCAHKGLDKIFFLTAKTSGRQLALDALRTLQSGQAVPMRVLELVAREKACEHPDKACHGQSCPLANGFYDRLPQARKEATRINWDKNSVRTLALAHELCPYYLAQDLARWADVTVADYNYYFDSSALLYALALEYTWKTGVLVDEAHNLVARARDMYSAALVQREFLKLRAGAPPELKKALDGLHRAWNKLNREQTDFYQVLPAVPDSFRQALRNAVTAIGDYFTRHAASGTSELQRFYFDVLQFSGLIDSFGAHALIDVTKFEGTRGSIASTLSIRNVVPAPYLETRVRFPSGLILFSATLSPWYFYSDLLGLQNPRWIEVESPFQSSQLQINIGSHISTRYHQRKQSLHPIAEVIAKQFSAKPGNYLAFFSSFDYLRDVLHLFEVAYPHIPVWSQTPGMSETERDQFISRFNVDGCGIGFAVLGGAFGEGIDLPGARLIGAFIATLGLPQVNQVNEEMKVRMDSLFGNGYAYTYQYPGLQKVVQAAGRVIRTSDDKGVIHLIDDRFTQPEIRALLPNWWAL